MNEPNDQAISVNRASNLRELREIVSIVHAEMDSARNRRYIDYVHFHRWTEILREALGCDYTDSSWLQSIGFTKDATQDNYRLKNWLVLKCDAGKWQAYSVKSSHWHYLCDVDRREEVINLINALKLNTNNTRSNNVLEK